MNRSIVICAYGVVLSVMAPAMAQEEAPAPSASTEQQPAAPGAFSGFYLGMGGGAVILDTKSDRRTNAAHGHDYGLLGGYGTQLQGTRIYLGAELQGQFGVGDLETAEMPTASTTVTIQRGSQETWGASGLFGVVTSPAMMIYGRGGYSWASLSASATDATMVGDPARSSADSSGIHYGIGADAILTSKLTLRTEWLQTQLDTLPAVAAAPSTMMGTSPAPAAISPRLEPRLNQFQLSLLWRFGGTEPAPPAANVGINNGVYFGFGGGYQASGHTNNDVCATGQTCDLYQGRLAVNGINAQAYIGFGVAATEKYYAAVEAGYGRLLRDNTTQTYNDGSTSRVDIKNELAGSLIVGRLFRPDLMAYLRLGYQRGSFNYQYENSASGRSSDSKKLDAFVFGIGTETALPRGLFARVEWQYMDYRTWRVATSNPNLARTLGDQDHYRLLAGVGIRL